MTNKPVQLLKKISLICGIPIWFVMSMLLLSRNASGEGIPVSYTTSVAALNVLDGALLPTFWYDSVTIGNNQASFVGQQGSYYAGLGFPSNFGSRETSFPAPMLGQIGHRSRVNPKYRMFTGVNFPVVSFFEIKALAMLSQGESYDIRFDTRERKIGQNTYYGPLRIQLQSGPSIMIGYAATLNYYLGPFALSFGWKVLRGSRPIIKLQSVTGQNLNESNRQYLASQVDQLKANGYNNIDFQVSALF